MTLKNGELTLYAEILWTVVRITTAYMQLAAELPKKSAESPI